MTRAASMETAPSTRQERMQSAIDSIIAWTGVHGRNVRSERRNLLIMALEREVPDLAALLSAYRASELHPVNLSRDNILGAEEAMDVMRAEIERIIVETSTDVVRYREMIEEGL